MTTLVSTVDRLGLRLPEDFNDISLGYRPDWPRRILRVLPFFAYLVVPVGLLFVAYFEYDAVGSGLSWAAIVGVASTAVIVAAVGTVVLVAYARRERGDPSLMQAAARAFHPTTWDRDSVAPEVRALAELIRQAWPTVIRQMYDLPLGDDLSSAPALIGVDEDPRGLRIWLSVPPGSDAERVRELEPRLGSLLRRPVGLVASDQSTVMFSVRLRDPLAAPVRVNQQSVSAGLGVVLGKAESGAAVLWSPPDDLSHLAIQGQSRSGKSSLLYGVVAQLLARKAFVVGIDPAGNLFKGGWPSQSLPDGGDTSALIANGLGDAVQLRGVLEGLLTLLDERLASLAASPGDKFGPDDPDHPPVFVVLDEFAGLVSSLKSDDQARQKEAKLGPLLETVKNRLLAEGLKVNLVLVISTQRFDASILGGAARSNIRTRVTLRVDNLDAMKMLHESIPEETRAAIPSFPPGRAVVEGASDSFDLREIQTPFTPFTEYQRTLGGGGDARP